MNQTKLLLIDPKVENYHDAIAQVDPNTKVVILEPDGDGVEQISLHLSKCYQLESVHIISHGAKGALYLGNCILNLDNIHLYVESIQQWGKYLSAGGEILIYGCQVACGKEGREFVRQLHQLTGANIAASETLTGNASIGGNWDLEVIFGQLKSALAFTPEVRASYAGVLANIVVNTGDDVVDDSDGVTSLREAIIQANTTPEDDTIQLTAGATYDLTISGSDEDAAATGDLDIVAGGGEITVISEGEEKAVIDAGGIEGISDRVFHVLEDGSLQLENIEVTGGFFVEDIGFGTNSSGGGIFNSGTVSINDSTVSGNLDNSDGGGIYNTGTANISYSTISSNTSSFGVGGIYNTGTANISYSTISSNISASGANFVLGVGGGIENLGTANISYSTISDNDGFNGGGINNKGTVSISNSIISGNVGFYGASGVLNSGIANVNNSTITAGARGIIGGSGIGNSGTVNINNSTISDNLETGIHNQGTANINNSTISNNSGFRVGGIDNLRDASISISNSIISNNSGSYSGGIENFGIANISNSTISSNLVRYFEAPFGDYGVSGNGGGINNLGTASISNSTVNSNSAAKSGGGIYNSGTATVTSSIISGNIKSDVDSVENNNTLISGDHNLIGTGNAIDNFNGENDQTGVTDPRLGDLADNGGPTFTHLPLPNSPAIDAGSNPNALTTDQRGEPRFVGEGVDIGAVELLNSPQITGTPESDRLNGTNENNTITGLAGNDTIDGRGGDDQIIGSRGSDFLYGKDGNDTLEGRLDNNHLFGGNGDDSILGGQGRDRINGGAGNDTLTGGASIDRFIFNTNQEFTTADVGVDTITDFVREQDIILLDKTTFSAITSDSGTGFSLNAEFVIVTSDADAATSEAVIVYNSNNGKLFYNPNGAAAEFGSGGEFANLTNTASISGDDFFVRG